MILDGLQFTNFKNVRLRGNDSGPGALRFRATSGVEHILTVDADYADDDKTITLPNKTGTIGVTGTFTVQLEAIAANTFYGTNVAVSGLRAEDAVVATIQNMTTTGIGTRGYVFLAGITPGTDYANVSFVNATNTATIYSEIVVAYTAVR